jgi:hypothetical protein
MSNIVPNPAYSAPPRPIGPTVIQASPGATTTLITRRPTPPAHQQTGLPKDRGDTGIRQQVDALAATRTAGCGGSPRRRPACASPSLTARPAARRWAPSLTRDVRGFVYEAMILFGIGLVPGLIGAIFTAQTGHREVLQSDTALRIIAFVIYGIYFVWFLGAKRPDSADANLAHPRRDARRRPLSQGRALLRYVACWIWIVPGCASGVEPALGSVAEPGAVAVWIVCLRRAVTAASQRQFWTSAVQRTRLRIVPRRDGRRDDAR